MNIDKILGVAEEIVKCVYPNDFTEREIQKNSNKRFRGEYSGIIKAGAFRSTIVPNEFNFIIKTPLNNGGARQCEAEAINYDRAKQWHLEHYFAAYYGTFQYREHTFYVFKKIPNVGCGGREYDDVMTEYSRRKGLKKFLHFYKINDLHGGNYGKIGRSYILTDYSGIDSEDWRC